MKTKALKQTSLFNDRATARNFFLFCNCLKTKYIKNSIKYFMSFLSVFEKFINFLLLDFQYISFYLNFVRLP